MKYVRSVSLHALSSRPLHRSRLCRLRPVHVVFTTRFSRRLCLNSRLRAHKLGHEVEFDHAQEGRYAPAYTETLSFALVNAVPELKVEEAEIMQPLPRNVENMADDPSLGNPLERLHRMGTGWFGVILDFEGIIVQSALEAHKGAWIRLAEEEGKSHPLHVVLHRAAPMKAEQAISEVLCWSREPSQVTRLALRKEELFAEMAGDATKTAREGLYGLLGTLKKHNIPVAVCSTERRLVYECMQSLALCPYVDVVVSAEDVYRCAPDSEAYAYAAQKLGRPPFRCVVLGASNHSCEAAHGCGMKSVASAISQPLYELNAADLVIKQLDEISFVNLKQLFRHEEFRDPQGEGQQEQPESTLPFNW